MNNLESNLYTLALLATQIKVTTYSLKTTIENQELIDNIEFDDNFLKPIRYPNTLRGIISNHLKIQFCSFLDEYKKFNPNYLNNVEKDRIIKVKRKNSYGISRINQWTDLYNYRNQIVAHNYDIKKEPILKKEKKTDYNIPNTVEEDFLIFKIIEKICKNIFEEFSEIRDNFDFKVNLQTKLNFIKNELFDLDSELELINKEM